MADNGRQKGEAVLLLALAAGASVRDAAKKAGIGERTAYRHLDNEEFRRQLAALRSQLIDQAVGRLADAATAAADTLRELLDGEPPQVRLGAARAIIGLLSRFQAAEDRRHSDDRQESQIPIIQTVVVNSREEVQRMIAYKQWERELIQRADAAGVAIPEVEGQAV